VALARALYSWTSLLLLDDIFSALDTKTSLALWNRVFCSDLIKHRTVVLVTQLTWVMHEADVTITLENGRIKSVDQNIGHVRTPKAARSQEDRGDEAVSSGHADILDDVAEEANPADDGQTAVETGNLTIVDEEAASSGVLGGLSCGLPITVNDNLLDPEANTSPSHSVPVLLWRSCRDHAVHGDIVHPHWRQSVDQLLDVSLGGQG
jgi:energy-coupling factor transporter ATP-binding protein EcfA2